MKKSGFQISGDRNNPYHFSVGVVIVDGNSMAIIKKPNNHYTLPRETAYSSESLQDSVARGLQEEVGVTAEIKRFLGSLIELFYRPDGAKIEKTTSYFFCIKTGVCNKTPEADETEDEIMWMSIEEALGALKACSNSEYRIVERTLTSM